MDFAVPSEQREKIKKTKREIFGSCQKAEKSKTHESLTDALGMVFKDIERRQEELEIRGRTKNIQTIALLRYARIRGRVQDI